MTDVELLRKALRVAAAEIAAHQKYGAVLPESPWVDPREVERVYERLLDVALSGEA